MITTAQVAVPGSAVSLVTVPPGATVALSIPGGTVYAGGAGVTSSTGAPITGYVALPPNAPTGSATTLYAVAASGTVSCGVIVVTPRLPGHKTTPRAAGPARGVSYFVLAPG
jgi:hypothetical protein